jgi:two-component system nitrate/nitrite response regulator NarL
MAALQQLSYERPALAVLEVEIDGSSGLELLVELRERHGENLPVILISSERTTPSDRVAGLLVGANDYIVVPFDPDEFVARVRRLLPRAAADRGGSGGQRAEASLTPREREVLALLANGKTPKQIAAALVISPKTVATHIQHVLAKLGVHSRVEAVALAFQLGLVDADVAAHALVA